MFKKTSSIIIPDAVASHLQEYISTCRFLSQVLGHFLDQIPDRGNLFRKSPKKSLINSIIKYMDQLLNEIKEDIKKNKIVKIEPYFNIKLKLIREKFELELKKLATKDSFTKSLSKHVHDVISKGQDDNSIDTFPLLNSIDTMMAQLYDEKEDEQKDEAVLTSFFKANLAPLDNYLYQLNLLFKIFENIGWNKPNPSVFMKQYDEREFIKKLSERIDSVRSSLLKHIQELLVDKAIDVQKKQDEIQKLVNLALNKMNHFIRMAADEVPASSQALNECFEQIKTLQSRFNLPEEEKENKVEDSVVLNSSTHVPVYNLSKLELQALALAPASQCGARPNSPVM